MSKGSAAGQGVILEDTRPARWPSRASLGRWALIVLAGLGWLRLYVTTRETADKVQVARNEIWQARQELFQARVQLTNTYAAAANAQNAASAAQAEASAARGELRELRLELQRVTTPAVPAPAAVPPR
jgi:hypothetical protein